MQLPAEVGMMMAATILAWTIGRFVTCSRISAQADRLAEAVVAERL